MITHKVIFYDAYTIHIQPIPLDWASKDQFINLNITFAYRYWEEDTAQTDAAVESTKAGIMQHSLSLAEMMSWSAYTIDLINLYTDSVPTALMQAQQISGIGGTIAGIGNELLGRIPPWLRP